MDIADIQAECSAGVNGYGGRRRRRSRMAATATIATTIAAASMYVAISGTGISKTRRKS
jgi:hypothetical protein